MKSHLLRLPGLAIAGFALAAAGATDAVAQQQSERVSAGAVMAGTPYFSGSLGYTFPQNGDMATGSLGMDNGINANAALGWDFGRPGSGPRVEAEVAFRRNGVSDGGDVDIWSGMANAYWDFDFGMPIRPYVGGGVGIARVDYRGVTGPGGEYMTGDSSDFAWQAMAGASWSVNERTDLYGGWRYFNVPDSSANTALGSVNVDDLDSHAIEVGVRWRF
ncbi:outer membrane protein [Telmatospirillum sp. J64-1]|uniref:outer membrane protein n=1 Tax=Telmatospirillum sp. J64-1 TaxID=2502183 RepID=UPI00163DB4F7|nr:outer membrane beta-barrel protein [Telmatospirillum sp. J64-1]